MGVVRRILGPIGQKGRAVAVLLVMWAIGLAGFAVVWKLQEGSDDQRRAQIAIEQIRRQVSAAPAIPFDIGPGHTTTPAQVRREFERSRAQMARSIEQLRAIDEEHAGVGLQLLADRFFDALHRVMLLTIRGKLDLGGAELALAARPGGALYELEGALASRSTRDEHEASEARGRAFYALFGAILLILVAFSLALFRSTSQRRRAEKLAEQNTDLLERSRQEEERYRDLFENANEPIATVDLEWRLTAVNRAFATALGYDPEELIGTPLTDYMTPESRELASMHRLQKLSGQSKASTYEQEFVARDGSVATFEVSTRLIEENGEPAGVQGMCRDITARKEADAELRRLATMNEHQAKHDALTALPNRRLFQQRIEEALTGGMGAGGSFAVLVIDLDDFKQVNDSLGHQSGDALLTSLAGNLQRAVREQDTVARLGGDEFGVLIHDAALDDCDWVRIVNRIERALDEPVQVQGVPVSVGASIGIAFCPEHGTTAELLLQRADVAMYVAKEERRGRAVYDPIEDRNDAGRLRLLGELKHALANRELVVHYQPIVELQGGDVSRVEALVRWQHPERGLIAPSEFIPIAEQTGLIKPLTLWVLDEAVRQLKAWEQDGHELSVAVNLSSRNLSEPDLVDNVLRILAAREVDPGRLLLEVTESAIITDPIHTQDVLRGLSEHGIRIALDDFGAGYTSLGYLSQLSLDEVKIDRSFVERLAVDEAALMIVRSIIHLGHELGHEIIAEGVESGAELRELRELECDHVQGSYFSRPMPPDRLLRWLAGLAGERVTEAA